MSSKPSLSKIELFVADFLLGLSETEIFTKLCKLVQGQVHCSITHETFCLGTCSRTLLSCSKDKPYKNLCYCIQMEIRQAKKTKQARAQQKGLLFTTVVPHLLVARKSSVSIANSIVSSTRKQSVSFSPREALKHDHEKEVLSYGPKVSQTHDIHDHLLEIETLEL